MTGVFHPFLLHLYTLFSKQSFTGWVTSPPQPFIFVVSAIQYQQIQFPNKMGKIHLKSFFPLDYQVKLVQQQVCGANAWETQDSVVMSRGGKSKTPFFGGKDLSYNPGGL